MRSWACSPRDGVRTPTRRGGDWNSLCHVRTQQAGSNLQPKDRALSRPPTLLAPGSWISTFQNWEKWIPVFDILSWQLELMTTPEMRGKSNKLWETFRDVFPLSVLQLPGAQDPGRELHYQEDALADSEQPKTQSANTPEESDVWATYELNILTASWETSLPKALLSYWDHLEWSHVVFSFAATLLAKTDECACTFILLRPRGRFLLLDLVRPLRLSEEKGQTIAPNDGQSFGVFPPLGSDKAHSIPKHMLGPKVAHLSCAFPG